MNKPLKISIIIALCSLGMCYSQSIAEKEINNPLEANFAKWSNFWIDNAGEKIYSPQDLETGITREKKEVAQHVFRFLNPIILEFLNTVKCEPNSTEVVPEVREALCINRILKPEDFIPVNPDVKARINELLEETFYLGVFSHLYLWKFETRNISQNVDRAQLFQNWQIDAISADYVMGYYGDPENPVLMNLWEYHYQTYVMLVLESNLNLSPFQEGVFKSYFRNLYIAGALLVMDYDLSTKAGN